MKPETKFQNRVIKDLKKLPNLWYLKTQEKARRGVPDLILCVKGRFIAIEIKISAEAPVSPLQRFELDCIAQAGGRALIATPSSWEILYAAIELSATT